MKRVSVACLSVTLLLATLSGCASLYRDLEQPTVRLISVVPQQVSFSGLKLLCQLRIDNPNDVSIPIKGGKFNLEVENTQVASGALIDAFTIARQSSELVDVVINVDSGRSLALAAQLLGGGKQELSYALTGYVDVAIAVLGRVRLNETGSVQLNGESAL